MNQWEKCSKAESILKELKVKYTTGTFKLTDVNWKRTLENCGRLGKPLSETVVQDYSEAMTAGDTFPMPVIVKEQGGILIVAGVHRCKAATVAGMKEVPVYIADSQIPAIIRLIAVMINRKEGVRVSREEALEYAVHMVVKEDIGAKDACKYLGVNISTLEHRLAGHRIRKELTEREVPLAAKLSDTICRTIRKLSSNSKVLDAVAELAAKEKLTEDETRELVRMVQEKKTEAEQLEIVEREKKRIHPDSNGKGGSPVITLQTRTRFIRALHVLGTTILGKKTIQELQIVAGSDESKELHSQWNELKRTLDKIFAAKDNRVPATKTTAS